MNSRRLDSKADSTCTASNVEAPQREGRRSAFSVPQRPFVRPIRDVGPVRGDRRPPRCYRDLIKGWRLPHVREFVDAAAEEGTALNPQTMY